MQINPSTRALLSLLDVTSFSEHDMGVIKALIDGNANLIIRNPKGENAFSLAIKSNQPAIMNFFESLNPDYFSSKVREMQSMWIIGKEKGGVFTASELERTQMDEIEKGLDIIAPKTAGISKGEIAIQSLAKTAGKAPTAYVLKKAADYSIQHLREVIGARLYAYFAGSKGTIMAKTRLVSRAGEDIIPDNASDYSDSSDYSITFRHLDPQKKIDLGSRILPESFTQYSLENGPRIDADGKLVVSINNLDQEVKGYLSAMTVAKFIHDFDCDGFGSNDGYIITHNGVQNAKIDPGRALGFIDDTNAKITDVSEGITILLTYKMLGDEYRTFIPLEYIDINNPAELRSELAPIDSLLQQYYPGLDVRDPVIGKITYAEVRNSPALYHEFAETIYDIVTCSEENLYHLISHNLPESINYCDTGYAKEVILEQLRLRQKVMHRIYPQEVEYMERYREFEAAAPFSRFENIMEMMNANSLFTPQKKVPVLDQNALMQSEGLTYEIAQVWQKLLQTGELLAKQDLQLLDIIAKAKESISSFDKDPQESVQHIEQSESLVWADMVRRSKAITNSFALDK